MGSLSTWMVAEVTEGKRQDVTVQKVLKACKDRSLCKVIVTYVLHGTGHGTWIDR